MKAETTAAEQDTLTWLLTTEGCAYCGAHVTPDEDTCATCGRSQSVVVRSAQRSSGVSALAGAWALGAGGAAMMALGAWLQLSGRICSTPAQSDSQLVKSLARLAGVQSFDAPINAPPPPVWFLPTMLALFVAGSVMAWGYAARRPWAFYLGLGLSSMPALLGLAAVVTLRGVPALAPLIAGMLASALLVLAHLSTQAQMLGTRQRIDSSPAAGSAIGLYRAGVAQVEAGLVYLGARQIARALGKDAANPAMLHTLALALANLGLRERALTTLDYALAIAPADAQLRATRRLIEAQQ